MPSNPPPAWAVPLAIELSQHIEHHVNAPLWSWLDRLLEHCDGLVAPDLLEHLSPPQEVLETRTLGLSDPVSLGFDDDEARFAIGGTDSGIAVARRNGGTRIDRYLLSESEASDLRDLKEQVRWLESWRGRGILLGFSIAGRFLVGATSGPRAGVPREVVRLVDGFRESMTKLTPLLENALAAQQRFLGPRGGPRAKAQLDQLQDQVRRFLPEISIGAPYEFPDSKDGFGALLTLRFPGISRSRLEVPLILEWSPEDNWLVDVQLAIKGLGPDSSLRRFLEQESDHTAEPTAGHR